MELTLVKKQYDLTKLLVNQPLQTDYFRRLTDDTGIFQHSKFGIPDRTKGYTSDDNARALIAAVMLYRNKKNSLSLDLIYTYLSFIHHAQNEDGSFKNFMDYNRQFIEEVGSDDCLGRCL
ncbi:MAG TPA: glycosyltransferase, partial [Bacilli bacterium]